MQEKTSKMELWGQNINNQMDELQTGVAKTQTKTKEQVVNSKGSAAGNYRNTTSGSPT